MASAAEIRSRATRWPVAVVVETKIARSGNRFFKQSTRGFAARTSPTDTAWTQIAVRCGIPQANPCGSLPMRCQKLPRYFSRRSPWTRKYGASSNMPIAVNALYKKYIKGSQAPFEKRGAARKTRIIVATAARNPQRFRPCVHLLAGNAKSIARCDAILPHAASSVTAAGYL
jgi:hypothetical protein